MVPTDAVSTRHHPKALYICAVIFVALACAGRIAYEQISWAHADLVKWRTIADGEKEALRDRKPILYFFTAAWCPPCKRLKGEGFANAEIAEYINANFVPVMIVDRQMEDGTNPPDVKKREKRYSVDSFPTLVLEHWELLNGDPVDVFSPSSHTHELLRSDRWWLPKFKGFSSKEDLKENLRVAHLWLKLPAGRGQVNWRPAQGLKWRQASKDKSTLIVVLTQRHEESNKARLRLFSWDKASDYLNRYFDCYLLEHSRAGASPTHELAEEARRRYDLKRLPAFIVLTDGDKETPVSCGFSGAGATFDFLERATHGKAKAPDLEEKAKDDEEED